MTGRLTESARARSSVEVEGDEGGQGVPTSHEASADRARAGRIDFEMSGQTFVSMVGPSGCGKSIFLNIVSGDRDADNGHRSRVSDRRGGDPLRLGYVFQYRASSLGAPS